MPNHSDPQIIERDHNYMDYRLTQIEKTFDRHDKELCAIRDKQNDVARDINGRIDDLRREINEKIDNIQDMLTAKIEENRAYNSRWFIGILASLLTSIVLIMITNLEIFR